MNDGPTNPLHAPRKQDRAVRTVTVPGRGGLMSLEPVETVHRQMVTAVRAARELGSTLHDPFMTMGFLALEVIPHLKRTDKGLVDVNRVAFMDLWVD